MDAAAFAERLAARAAQTEAALDRLLPKQDGAAGRVAAAMRYAALGGGKRLRAFLTLECAALFGAPEACAERAAAALECVHAYSLAHDDLPALSALQRPSGRGSSSGGRWWATRPPKRRLPRRAAKSSRTTPMSPTWRTADVIGEESPADGLSLLATDRLSGLNSASLVVVERAPEETAKSRRASRPRVEVFRGSGKGPMTPVQPALGVISGASRANDRPHSSRLKEKVL